MVGLLKPFLQHSLWPAMSVSDYAQVNRTWDLPEPALLFQYGLLVERVRCAVSLAFRRRRWSATFDPTGSNVQTAPEEVVQAVVEEWFVLQSVSVRPLFVLDSIEASVKWFYFTLALSASTKLQLYCSACKGQTIKS